MKDQYGLNSRFNDEWRDLWYNVISTDNDTDGDYLIRLIVHKLGNMIAAFKKKPDTDYVVTQMVVAHELGVKILTHSYGTPDLDIREFALKNDSLNEKENILSDYAKAEKAREADIKYFFNIIGENVNSWWIS